MLLTLLITVSGNYKYCDFIIAQFDHFGTFGRTRKQINDTPWQIRARDLTATRYNAQQFSLELKSNMGGLCIPNCLIDTQT